jgi:hypothetical protein
MNSSAELNRQHSWQSSESHHSLSRFREHLSIVPPTPNRPVEKSHFSPESIEQAPSSPHGVFRHFKHAVSASTSTKRSARSPSPAQYQPGRTNVDLESAGVRTRYPRSVRDRLTQFFLELGPRQDNNSSDGESVGVPMEDRVIASSSPPLAWPPLHVEKRNHHHDCTCGRKKRSCISNTLLVVLIILLLYLLVDSVFVTASVLHLRDTTRARPSPASTATTGMNSTNSDVLSCLTQYMVNAPSSPSSYPCSECLPLLQNASTAEIVSWNSNSQYAQQTASDAVQFCGLRAIFESATPTGQSALGQAGWVKDNRFCAWQDVTCNGSGDVSTLKLTFPAVPAVIPHEIGALTGLTILSIVGDGNVPAGKPPAELSSLPSLTSLELESTALSVSPDISTTLTSYQLIKNAAMSPTLPASVFSSSLTSLVINSQPLTNPLAQIAASSGLQSSLKVLDLTQTQLSGTVPGSLAILRALTEVHLDGNQLTGTLPTFGKNVVVTAKNNTGLQGA